MLWAHKNITYTGTHCLTQRRTFKLRTLGACRAAFIIKIQPEIWKIKIKYASLFAANT